MLHPLWICHGEICFGQVVFPQTFNPQHQLNSLVLDPLQLCVLFCGRSVKPAELATSEMARLKQRLSNCPTTCLGRDVSSRSCSLPLHQSTVLTFSEKHNCCLLVLPSPFKPRRCQGSPESYSCSAKLVFHPDKKLILVILVAAKVTNTWILAQHARF